MLGTASRETALKQLDIEHNAIRDLINSLTDEEMTRPDTIEYGLYADQELSFKDLLAHLITYEAWALEAIAAWQQGQKHWISDAMDSAEGSRRVHYSGIEDRRSMPLDAVLAEWEQTQASLMNTIRGLSDHEWKSPAPYPTHSATDLSGMLEAILVAPPRPLYRHLPVHIPDAQAFIHALRSG